MSSSAEDDDDMLVLGQLATLQRNKKAKKTQNSDAENYPKRVTRSSNRSKVSSTPSKVKKNTSSTSTSFSSDIFTNTTTKRKRNDNRGEIKEITDRSVQLDQPSTALKPVSSRGRGTGGKSVSTRGKGVSARGKSVSARGKSDSTRGKTSRGKGQVIRAGKTLKTVRGYWAQKPMSKAQLAAQGIVLQVPKGRCIRYWAKAPMTIAELAAAGVDVSGNRRGTPSSRGTGKRPRGHYWAHSPSTRAAEMAVSELYNSD